MVKILKWRYESETLILGAVKKLKMLILINIYIQVKGFDLILVHFLQFQSLNDVKMLLLCDLIGGQLISKLFY